MQWCTTFAFLRRIGLEQFAYNLEDQGFKLWSGFKHLTKDELKDKGQMSDADAIVCHAVLTNSAERPDLLRKFAKPEYADIVVLFSSRFPHAKDANAREFALQLTDGLGVCDFSCHQIEAYLKDAKGPFEAKRGISEGLLPLDKAEAARKRPDPPPPTPTPTCWVYTWLKSKELEANADAFIGQALTTREDVLEAPLDHKSLTEMGITKIGERTRVLRCIEEERSNPKPLEEEKSPEKNKDGSDEKKDELPAQEEKATGKAQANDKSSGKSRNKS